MLCTRGSRLKNTHTNVSYTRKQIKKNPHKCFVHEVADLNTHKYFVHEVADLKHTHTYFVHEVADLNTHKYFVHEVAGLKHTHTYFVHEVADLKHTNILYGRFTTHTKLGRGCHKHAYDRYISKETKKHNICTGIRQKGAFTCFQLG